LLGKTFKAKVRAPIVAGNPIGKVNDLKYGEEENKVRFGVNVVYVERREHYSKYCNQI